jgi:hypothetical protein
MPGWRVLATACAQRILTPYFGALLAHRFFAVALGAALVPLTIAPNSRANPRPLPFTYQHEQLAAGESELEQFVDLTPVRAYSEGSGEPAWYGLSAFQTEFEHGISDRLELGLYLSFVPGVASGYANAPRAREGTGLKQRLRYQLAPTGEWPVDLGIYGEIVENEREVEFEAKLILQRRLGRVRLVANVTAEEELYYDGKRDFVLAPSAGITFEPTPAVQPGLEWWMQGEYPHENAPSPRPFQLGPHHYLGPTLLIQFGRLWWTNGIYVRLNEMDHTMVAGVDSYGLIWARSVIGVGL